MKKRILYSGLIIAMLMGMFGVMAPGGVQTAQAADSVSWYDGAPSDAALPYANVTVNMTSADGSATDDEGGFAGTSFGAYQLHLFDNVADDEPAGFYRVRVESDLDDEANQWAVKVKDATTGDFLGGAEAVGGVVDLTVPVDEGQDVKITLANIDVYVPTDTTYWTYVARFELGGGLIVDMHDDGGTLVDGRAVEASDGATAYWGEPDSGGLGVFFVDVPDGEYDLGIQDTNDTGHPFVAFEPDVEPYVYLKPHTDATESIPVSLTCADSANDAEVYVNVNESSGFLVVDLTPGDLAGGALTFYVSPEHHWDLAVFKDDTGDDPNYFLVSLDFNTMVGDLVFDLCEDGIMWVEPTLQAGWDDADVLLAPPGNLNERWIDIAEGELVETDSDYESESIFLLSREGAGEAGPFEVQEIRMEEECWRYFFMPTIPSWGFPHIVEPEEPAYAPIIGDPPYITTPMPNATSQEEYRLPLAEGEVALMRGPWTDQFGNTLFDVVEGTVLEAASDSSTRNGVTCDFDPETDIHHAPEYWLTNATDILFDEWELLAYDWELTDLGPITEVGRYLFDRVLAHGNLTEVGGDNEDEFLYEDLFAISPADVPMLGHWSWSWVEAMYEYGFTTGVDAMNYGPEQTVSRGQMAAFLGRVMGDFGLEPTGLAPDFDDVPESHWAYESIMLLRDYGITDGVGNNLYAPEAEVTRAEMAKFIEETFRAIQAYTGAIGHWDPSWDVPIPTGIAFVDVGLDNWAVKYIEELFFDGLTDGCRREGLDIYYCPDSPVKRGEMAKFIMRAVQEDLDTQSFWPILAPEK